VTFFQKFQGSGLYSGATYVQTFPKNHALHTARYGMPRSALDHNQLTHSTPQSLTVSAAVWPPLPRPPCLSLSLSVYATVYCTHWQSVGKLPPEVPCWARSCGPQVAVVISQSARINASRRTLTHTRHTTDPLCGAHSLYILAWHQITASLQTLAHVIKPACRVFWTTSIASCRSFADLLITCMHPRTFLRARK